MGYDTTFLADGTPRRLNYYQLIVEWDGEEREIDVIAIESEPLLGVTMLEGYKACFDFAANTLTIEAA